jgi:hypothetical protein
VQSLVPCCLKQWSMLHCLRTDDFEERSALQERRCGYIVMFATMLLTPHTLVGLAIGASVQKPEIAVPISIAMHFLGDLVPHWDFYSDTTKEVRLKGWRPLAVMLDLVLGVAVGLTITLYALWVVGNISLAINMFLCGIAAVLPDALEGPYIFLEKEPKILRPLTAVQRKLQFQAPLPWGVISQVLVAFVSLLVISNSVIL